MKRNLYLVLAATVGISFLLWLSFNTRLSYDDYLFAACFKKNSCWDAFTFLYNTHAFRWTTFLFEYLVLGIVPGEYYPLGIPLFFLVFYTCWIAGLSRLALTLAQRLDAEMNRVQSLSLAALFVLAVYFSASQAVESFTSIIIVTDRLLPLLFITAAINIFLKPEMSWKNWLILGALAFLIAGTAENVTATLLMGLTLYLFAQRFLQKRAFAKSVLVFTLLLLLFFAFENLSPGRSARYFVEKTFHFTCGTDGVYCANTFGEFLGRFFQVRQLFVLLPALLFAATAGLIVRGQVRLRRMLKGGMGFMAVLLPGSVVFHLASALWVFDCYGPMRMWFPVNILFAVLCVFAVVYAGLRIKLNRVAIPVLGMLLSASLVFYFSRHYAATVEYRRAYDARVGLLKAMKEPGGVVVVEPLPPVSLVVQGEITANEHDDVNRDFKHTYALPFDVRTK